MKRLVFVIVAGLAGAASIEEVLAEGACTTEGATTFCHELRHIRTYRTMIPPAAGSSGRPVVTLGFRFQGQRSCRSAEGEVVAHFSLAMHGISDPVVADYPDLMAQVLPEPAELERYTIGSDVGIIVEPDSNPPTDPSALRSLLAFDGLLFPDGQYVVIRYVPVADSLAACLAHVAGSH